MNDKIIAYPRELAKTELTTNKNVNTKLIVWENVSREQQRELNVKAQEFNYVSIYAYLFDTICYVIKNHKDKIVFDDDPNYYTVRLKKETIENVALGEYKNLKHSFWDNLIELTKKQRALYFFNGNEYVLGLPIITSIHYQKELSQTESNQLYNLKNISELHSIDYVEIKFNKTLFPIVENKTSFLTLPSHFQAFLDNFIQTNKDYFCIEYQRNGKTKKVNITSQQLRLYFLYMQQHDNNIGTTKRINALEFWKCVKPQYIKKKGDNYYLELWYEAKLVLDRMVTFHENAIKLGIKGLNFIANKSFYHQKTKEYEININRQTNILSEPFPEPDAFMRTAPFPEPFPEPEDFF